MATMTPEMTHAEQFSIGDTIRHQLTEVNGVATQELSAEDRTFNVQTAHAIAEYAADNSEGSATQDLIGVVDTGKSLFGVVRASIVDRTGLASTRVFLTEVPTEDEQSSRLIHEFLPNPSGFQTNEEGALDVTRYNGVQPTEHGSRSRLQMMLDDTNTLHMRTDPTRPAESEYVVRGDVHFSFGFGHAVDTPPQDWIVPVEKILPSQPQATPQYQF